MKTGKYGELFKKLTFQDYGPGSFRPGVKIGKSFHGLNVHIQYGAFKEVGPIGSPAEGLHKHDFDQLLLFLGSDPENLLELGAEVELRLGPEREKQLFTVPTAVSVPRGFPHFPAAIKKLEKPFQYMEISLAPEWSFTEAELGNSMPESPTVSSFRSRYVKYTRRLLFLRKGPYFYGSNNAEDSGGVFTSITGHESGLELHISFESIKHAPYTFGPMPHGPHAHKFEEILLFMGPDCNNLNYLGGEAECAMGKERETHSFNVPMAVVCPEDLPHCPLTITKVEKPFLFMVVSCAAEHHPGYRKTE